MKKIVSLNVSNANIYDKSSLEVRIAALCRNCLKTSLKVAFLFFHGQGASPLELPQLLWLKTELDQRDIVQTPVCY